MKGMMKMKVQCLNSSSIKTRNLIKTTFAQLIHEKKQMDKVTVTELIQRANLTRSTFYTHFDNLYQVAQEYQLQTIELLCNEDLKLHSKEDILNYFDNIFLCLKQNEETYKLLLTANESILFLDKLEKIAGEKIYDALKNISNQKYLDLSISFLMDGITIEVVKYFRKQSKYSLEELHWNTKQWFQKIFN